MSSWQGTLAQKASLGLGVFFLLNGIIGLIVHPDFGTGSRLSSEQFVVDWNGWHAVLTLLFAVIAFVGAVKPLWALVFLAFNAIENANTAIWVLFDDTPFGILDLPHVSTDATVHALVASFSAISFGVQIARNRRARHISDSASPLAN